MLDVVWATSGKSQRDQRSPYHGKTRGKFHVEFVLALLSCTFYNWKKIHSRTKKLKIWWFLMNKFHV